MNKEEARLSVIGAISMALKDPILQQRFEIICKNLAELERENAELKADNEAKDIQIKELQEQKCYWKESSFDWRHKFFKKDKQLAKAEELLEKWVELFKPKVGNIPPTPIQEQTEQFLSEVEK